MLENVRLISCPYCVALPSCQMAIISCIKVSHFHKYIYIIYRQYSRVVTHYFAGLRIKHRHYIYYCTCAVTYSKFCIV